MNLTLQQLAEQWQVSQDTIRRHIYAGRLPATDLGTGRHRELRVSQEDADAFWRSRTVQVVKYKPVHAKRTAVVDHLG